MDVSELHSRFEAMRAASRAQADTPLLLRRERLLRLHKLLQDNEARLCASVQADFGQRSARVTSLTELLPLHSQLRQALEKPIDGSTEAAQQLRSDLDSAIANISSGQNQLAYTVTSIGARGKALDLQEQANESLSIANASTQSSIRDSDPAEVMTRLTLQQTMLQASQMAFSRISQLSLFNSL